jgi:uncharacterized membrane protein YeaQ/YmgE (transglycosylase-associated protein family)
MPYGRNEVLAIVAVAMIGAVIGGMYGEILASSVYHYKQTPLQTMYCALITAPIGAVALAILFSVVESRR